MYRCLQIWQGAGWILSSSSCLAVLFATYSWSRGQSARPAESIVYAILHRTVWAAGVAWILFICATGHGGSINTVIPIDKFADQGPDCKLFKLHFYFLKLLDSTTAFPWLSS